MQIGDCPKGSWSARGLVRPLWAEGFEGLAVIAGV